MTKPFRLQPKSIKYTASHVHSIALLHHLLHISTSLSRTNNPPPPTISLFKLFSPLLTSHNVRYHLRVLSTSSPNLPPTCHHPVTVSSFQPQALVRLESWRSTGELRVCRSSSCACEGPPTFVAVLVVFGVWTEAKMCAF